MHFAQCRQAEHAGIYIYTVVVLPVVTVSEFFDCSISVRFAAKLNQGMLLMADGYISTWNGLGDGPRAAVRLADSHHLHFTSHTKFVCQAVCATVHMLTWSPLLQNTACHFDVAIRA